jgi:hypothetical protein
MAEGECNLSQQHRNISVADLLETKFFLRLLGGWANWVEELRLRRQVCSYGAKRFLKFSNTLSRFDVLTGLTAVTPDDVVACDSL